MKPKPKSDPQSSFLLPDLATQLDPRHELCRLGRQIDWSGFEGAFGPLYSPEGRPALPIRRMVGLLILKQLLNLSDERVVEFWTLSGYAQWFCGESELQWGAAVSERRQPGSCSPDAIPLKRNDTTGLSKESRVPRTHRPFAAISSGTTKSSPRAESFATKRAAASARRRQRRLDFIGNGAASGRCLRAGPEL
jgi:hypothetical protein